MYDQIALTLESLTTRGAVIIELTRVCGRVLREADLAAERFLARHALKRFFAGVLTHVFL